MKTLVLLADINASTGYGKHAIQIARDFTSFGYNVKIRPSSIWEPAWGEKIPDDIKAMFVSGPQPEPVELLLHPPNAVPTPGKKVVYFSMHETTRLKPIAVAMLNKAHTVVVPCKQNAIDFKECGVTRPIKVVPLGIDADLFRYNLMPAEYPHVIRFGCAGRLAHGGVRKGLNEVIDLFLEAFPDDKRVRLDVKCFPDCEICHVRDPRICIHAAHWTDEQIAFWLSTLACFVSAARGEAWGLLQHQAIATGRRLISTRWAGLAEYFEPWMGSEIDHTLEPAQFAYEGQGLWAVPSRQQMINAMVCVKKLGVGDVKYRMEASRLVRQFSWRNSNRKLAEVIESL